MILRLLVVSALMMSEAPPRTQEQLVAHAQEEVLRHWGLVGTGKFAQTRSLRADYVKQMVCGDVAIPSDRVGSDEVVWTPFVFRERENKLESGPSAICR